jgi:hypothetical protein
MPQVVLAQGVAAGILGLLGLLAGLVGLGTQALFINTVLEYGDLWSSPSVLAGLAIGLTALLTGMILSLAAVFAGGAAVFGHRVWPLAWTAVFCAVYIVVVEILGGLLQLAMTTSTWMSAGGLDSSVLVVVVGTGLGAVVLAAIRLGFWVWTALTGFRAGQARAGVESPVLPVD